MLRTTVAPHLQSNFFSARKEMTLSTNLFHLLLVGPLFVYVGLVRDDVPEWIFQSLGVLALVILGYHAYRAYSKLLEGKSAWVNWIHMLLVAPLLLFLAYMKKDASRKYFEMLMLLGFAAIGYHAMYILRDTVFAA